MRITWEDDERKALEVLAEFGNVYRLAQRVEKLNKDHEECSAQRMDLRMNGMELAIERMGRDVAQIVAEMEAIKDALGKLVSGGEQGGQAMMERTDDIDTQKHVIKLYVDQLLKKLNDRLIVGAWSSWWEGYQLVVGLYETERGWVNFPIGVPFGETCPMCQRTYKDPDGKVV